MDVFSPQLIVFISCARRPNDLWAGLETSTVYGLRPNRLDPNQLSAWLVDRRALGLRRLHVTLINPSRYVQRL